MVRQRTGIVMAQVIGPNQMDQLVNLIVMVLAQLIIQMARLQQSMAGVAPIRIQIWMATRFH